MTNELAKSSLAILKKVSRHSQPVQFYDEHSLNSMSDMLQGNLLKLKISHLIHKFFF